MCNICSVVLWIYNIWMLGMAEGAQTQAWSRSPAGTAGQRPRKTGSTGRGEVASASSQHAQSTVPKHTGSSEPAEIPSSAPTHPQIPVKSRRWERPRKGCSMLSVRQFQPSLQPLPPECTLIFCSSFGKDKTLQMRNATLKTWVFWFFF